MNPERITGRPVLDRQLGELVAADRRLAPILAAAGEVPLRLHPGGFAGMARIVTAQLLSVASARAIHARVEAAIGEMTAERLLRVEDEALRAAGLSYSKIATLRAAAAAELDGQLDYEGLGDMPSDQAVAVLTEIKGIGRWSAEIYLLFSTGHPDIFPAGDLALRKAVGHVLDMAGADEKTVRELTMAWSPWRGAAARLMWRHYARTKAREGVI